MSKKTRWNIAIVIAILIIISTGGILLLKSVKTKDKIVGECWVSYFAPSSTNVAYGYGHSKAQIVKFDKLGNVEIHEETAYPFADILNFKNEIIYQSAKGIRNLNSANNETNIVGNKNTVGYNMSDILKNKDLFYFLLNESSKGDYYCSNIIIGDKEKQTLHQIKGFINGYGDDEENIYLLSSDEKNRNLKQIQKISLKDQGKIDIKINDIIFDTVISCNNKMIIIDGYIYCFVAKEDYSISILKISCDTLKLESVKDLIKFQTGENKDKYYPISTNSIFYKEDKIYYPITSGEVYSFDIKSNDFVKEFSIADYNFTLDYDMISYYSDYDSEVYFLYYENAKNKYCLSTYYLNGTFKNKIYLNNLKMNSKMYPHSFIKSN